MVSLGIRFSTRALAFAVLDGPKTSPGVIDCQKVQYPTHFAHVPLLDWVYMEIETICQKHNVSTVVIKKYEGQTKGNSYEERVHCEGVALLAAHRCSKIPGFVKAKSTLAKDVKGKAKYLKTKLPTNLVPNFSKYSEMEQEAIICSWSTLP